MPFYSEVGQHLPISSPSQGSESGIIAKEDRYRALRNDFSKMLHLQQVQSTWRSTKQFAMRPSYAAPSIFKPEKVVFTC